MKVYWMYFVTNHIWYSPCLISVDPQMQIYIPPTDSTVFSYIHRNFWIQMICYNFCSCGRCFFALKRWYLIHFVSVTDRNSFLGHHPIDENLGALDRLGKQFYIKMLLMSAWIVYMFLLIYLYLTYSNHYYAYHHKFLIQHQVTYQL